MRTDVKGVNMRMAGWLLVLAGVLSAGTPEEVGSLKIADAGLGYAMSSKGQSLFFTRGSDPFRTNQRYVSLGFHLEEQGLSLGIYNPYTGMVERNAAQMYYLESGIGLRRLLFQDKLAAGFFPHIMIEAGISGNPHELGQWRKLFLDTTMLWAPYFQVGGGASIYTASAIYRLELGYLATPSVAPTVFREEFPSYQGMFIKIIISNVQKPR